MKNAELRINPEGGLELTDESNDEAWIWTDSPATVKP